MSKHQPISTQVERTIAASPTEIYNLVSDVTRHGDWSPECTGAEWLDGATAANTGVRFKGDNELGSAKWSTKSTVTEARSGELFAFKVDGKMGPEWRYELTETPDGGTRIVESMSQTNPTNFFIRFIQRRNGVTDRKANLTEAMTITLDRLAAEVETATVAS